MNKKSHKHSEESEPATEQVAESLPIDPVKELEERLAGEVLHIQWQDQTYPALDFESISQEKTIRGRFVHVLNERIAAAAETERVILERARLYGVQALSGREVRLR